jgi:hypothetical protein
MGALSVKVEMQQILVQSLLSVVVAVGDTLLARMDKPAVQVEVVLNLEQAVPLQMLVRTGLFATEILEAVAVAISDILAEVGVVQDRMVRPR